MLEFIYNHSQYHFKILWFQVKGKLFEKQRDIPSITIMNLKF